MPNARHARLIVAHRCATVPCQRLSDDLGLEPLLGIHLLQALVSYSSSFIRANQGCVHASVPSTPLVERSIANAVFAAQPGTGLPPSAYLSMAMIWVSVKRDVFM